MFDITNNNESLNKKSSNLEIFLSKVNRVFKTEDDFLTILLTSNIDIPLENYKKFLENSNNKIIKKILPYFSQKREKFNNIIGVFNNKYQFIINEGGKKENLEFRGFACTSLKKIKQKQLLDTLNIKTKNTSTKNMCQDIKSHLFHKHISAKDSTTYFVIKMFL